LAIDESKAEGKLLVKIIDVLEEMAATIEDNSDAITACEERVDDLEDFADELCEEMGGCDCGCEDDDCDCCDCDCDEDDFDDEEFYEVECPGCNEKVYFDEDMLDDELICPNCNEKIEIEFED